MQAYPVKFIPVPAERIWGGSKLKKWFQAKTERPIGEYWVVSGHPNGTSVVGNGPLAGKTINELTEQYPLAYLGKSPQQRFPLLVKFIEAEDDLSVQIHPDDAYANEREGDFGKTEAWYILDRKPGGEVILGHTFQNREQFMEAVAAGNIGPYLKRRKIAPGDVVFVAARTMHALLAGTTLIEIQQTSDVTYRVFDWNRVDKSGKSRELHVDKAADVMLYGGEESPIKADTARKTLREETGLKHELLVSCPYFAIEKMVVSEREVELSQGHAGNPDVLIVADGEGELAYGNHDDISLRRGDAVLVPGTLANYRIRAGSGLTLLRTYY
ncbi:MAG TPA: type I phosphomannose isomerase catalytic subunit [Bacilli bacterium]